MINAGTVNSITKYEIRELELEQLNSKFEPTDQAFPTNRAVESSAYAEWLDDSVVEEWSEAGEVDGVEATRYYLFSKTDIEFDCGTPMDPEFYPFDADHVSRIIFNNPE